MNPLAGDQFLSRKQVSLRSEQSNASDVTQFARELTFLDNDAAELLCLPQNVSVYRWMLLKVTSEFADREFNLSSISTISQK